MDTTSTQIQPTTSQHTKSPPPQPPITSTNTNNTTTMFNKLVELHHRKNDHQQQLTILNKHITNHTAPADLNISMASGTACPTSQTSCTNTIQRNHPKLMGKSHHFPQT
jgi:hypothetical protein